MRAMHRAGAVVKLGDKDLLHAERLDTHTGADDIGNGIQCADFMKVNVFHGLPVNLALGLGDAMENRQRVLLHEGREFAVLDQLADLLMRAAVAMLMTVLVVMVFVDFAAVVVIVSLAVFMFMFVLMLMSVFMSMLVMLMGMRVGMLMFVLVFMLMRVPMVMIVVMLLFIIVLVMMPVLVLMPVFMGMRMPMIMMPLAMLAGFFVLVVRVRRAFVNAELHPFHLLPLLAVEVHMEIAEVELGELPFEGGGLDAEIDQSADGHVAGDARETIEEEDFHRRAAGRWMQKGDRCCTGYNPSSWAGFDAAPQSFNFRTRSSAGR